MSVFSQTGTLSGRILNNETKTPIQFARVYVLCNNKTIETQTDSLGKYKLKNIISGKYTLKVSSEGFVNYELRNVPVDSNKIRFLDDIFLNLKIIFENSNVIDKRFVGDTYIETFHNRDFITDDFEKIPERMNVQQLINTLTPGVYIDDKNNISYKGSRDNDIIFYIDGIKSRNMKIPSIAIANLTIYTGGVPARYGDFNGLVVVIETKSYFDNLETNSYEEIR